MNSRSGEIHCLHDPDPAGVPPPAIVGRTREIPPADPRLERPGNLNLHLNVFGMPAPWRAKRIAGALCVGLVAITVALMVALALFQFLAGR